MLPNKHNTCIWFISNAIHIETFLGFVRLSFSVQLSYRQIWSYIAQLWFAKPFSIDCYSWCTSLNPSNSIMYDVKRCNTLWEISMPEIRVNTCLQLHITCQKTTLRAITNDLLSRQRAIFSKAYRRQNQPRRTYFNNNLENCILEKK